MLAPRNGRLAHPWFPPSAGNTGRRSGKSPPSILGAGVGSRSQPMKVPHLALKRRLTPTLLRALPRYNVVQIAAVALAAVAAAAAAAAAADAAGEISQ